MLIPKPRGSLSDRVFHRLSEGSNAVTGLAQCSADNPDDAQITLWALYALHYTGFDHVPEELEWHPGLLSVRRRLEDELETDLRARFAVHAVPDGVAFEDDLFDFIDGQDGRSVAAHVQRRASRDEVLQLLRWRSIYHLQEADPTAWVVPRLGVRAKAALMELQYDEYGAGDPNRLHSHLFARGLAASGLSAEPGAYIDEVPVEVLEQNNAMSLFGLHRRLRGAALGHLAAFEATSSLPSRRMTQGLARLELPAELVAYYAEHVEADAVHEQLAVRTICGSLLDAEPALVDDVYLGAFCCLDLENRTAGRLLEEWGAS